jgi:hypothetical protein
MQATNVRTLFPIDPPTSEQAWEIVRVVPVDAYFDQVYKRCRGACCRSSKGHGPYWIAQWTDGAGKQKQKHLGSDAKYEAVLAAHAVVRAELALAEEAARSPELVRLRELEHRAYARGRAPEPRIVSVPIVDMKRASGGR